MVGRIVVNNRPQQLDIIVLIAMLHPQSNVMLVAPTRQHFESISRHLAVLPGRVVTGGVSTIEGDTSHIVLATTKQFTVPDPSYFQVVVFLDLHHCLGKRILDVTIPLQDHFIYAIENSNHPLGPRNDYRAEYLAGRQIYRVWSARDRRPLLTLGIELQPARSRPVTTLDEKRRLIWHHAERNQSIASLALEIIGNQTTALSARFGTDRVRYFPHDAAVAILVESTEHAQALQACLPEWGILTIEASGPPARLQEVIVTQLYVSRTHSLGIDILIRADGGFEPLSLRGFPGRSSEDNQRPVILVDPSIRSE